MRSKKGNRQGIKLQIWHLVALILLVVPLIYSTKFFNSYNLVKEALAYSLIYIMFGFLFYNSPQQIDLNFFKHRVIKWYLAYSAISIISTIKAPNPFNSLHQAIIIIGNLLLISLASKCIDSERKMAIILRCMVVSGLIVAAWGILQVMEVEPFRIEGIFDPVSTLGHRNFSAQVLLFFVPISIFMAYREQITVFRVISIISAILTFIHILLTNCRGAWLGVLAAIVLFILIYLVRIAKERLPLLKIIKSKEVLASTAIIFLVAVIGLRGTVIARFKSIFDTSSGTNMFRLLAWKSTLSMVADHPILGVGLGNFKEAYPPYRDPREASFSGLHVFVNHAHNHYLNILAESGPIALVSFMIFLVLLFYPYLRQRMLHDGNPGFEHKYLPPLVFGWIASLVHAFFSANLLNPASSIYFWFSSAIMFRLIYRPTEQVILQNKRPVRGKPSTSENRSARQILFKAVGILMIAGVPFYFFMMLVGDRYVQLGKVNEKHRQWLGAEKYYEKALRLYPFTYQTHYFLAYCYGMQGKYDQALRETNEALRYHPNYRNALFNRGVIYEKKGQYSKAIVSYREALSIDPRFISAQNNLIVVYEKLGQYEKALEVAKKALEFDPYSPDAHNNLGVLYFHLKDYEKALDEFKYALRMKNTIVFSPADINHLKILGTVWLSVAAFDKQGRQLTPFSEWGVVRYDPLSENEFKIDNPPSGFRMEYDPEKPMFIFEFEDVPNLYFYKIRYRVRNKEALYIFEKNEDVYARIHNNIGSIYQKEGSYDLAEDHFLEALRIRNDYLRALKNLAILYINQTKQYNKAVKILERLIQLDGDSRNRKNYQQTLQKLKAELAESQDR